ncbi:MAG: TlpA family protein disulfide reductase [Candidatus Paceibacteria bacterium]|jgi:thiol-disulfide isomerase/thioredoxin
MKKSFLIGLVVIGFLFSACDNKTTIDESVVVKSTSQDSNKKEFVSENFTLITTDEKLIPLKSTEQGLDFEEFKGKKAILVDVFATWCPPCIEEIPILKELREKYKNDFEIVSVLFEKDKPKQEILDFITKYQIEYPITVGEENFKLAKQLGDVKKIPEMFLFTKDGRFVKRFVGKTSKEDLEQYINLAIKN